MREQSRVTTAVLALCVMLVASACGDHIGSSEASDAALPSTYRVGGTVGGLAGELNLALNGTELVTIAANGDFTFVTELLDGDSYLVSLLRQPDGQTCTVDDGSGTIAGTNLSNVVVSCMDVFGGFTVGGTVTGLTSEVQLLLNGTELVTVSEDRDYAFTTKLFTGDSYFVALLGQPEGQICTVLDGAGNIAAADVIDASVECVDSIDDLRVGGSVGGLIGDVNLVLNGAELITVTGSGSFEFATLLQPGDSYLVTVLEPPAEQTCVVANGAGIVATSNISDVLVTCLPSAELISLVVTGDRPLSPVFDPTQSFYQLDVSFLVSEITLTPTAIDANAIIVLNGVLPLESGRTSTPISLDLGANSLSIVVTGIDGDTQSYVVEVTRGAAVLEQVAYAKASNSGATDLFGTSVAISGDTLAVASNFEDSGATNVGGDQTNNTGSDSGAVYVFRRSGSTWSQEAYIKASNTDPYDAFGGSIALSDDTLAVGAASEDSNAIGIGGDQTNNTGTNSGAVYVFRRSESTWSQEAYVKASNAESGDSFGRTVALYGDTLAVGVPNEDSNATGINGDQADNSAAYSGAVYVFHRVGTNWAQQAYVKASNTQINDHFGGSLSLFDDTLAVGAILENSNATGINGTQTSNEPASGAVYVFRRNGTTWAQEAYVKASNTDSGDRFGSSVALGANTLAVGVPNEDSDATGINGDQTDNSASYSGAVYVFRRFSGTVWFQSAYIKPSNTQAFDEFGSSIALSGDVLAVGAKGESSSAEGIDGDQADNTANASGAVYVFQLSGSLSQKAYVKASNTESTDYFGSSVALSGDVLVVGVPREDSQASGLNGDQDDNTAEGSGAVYIFH